MYNKAILQRYFALLNPLVHSVEEIRDFDTLQRVCDDIQARRAQLGIDACNEHQLGVAIFQAYGQLRPDLRPRLGHVQHAGG